MVSAAFFIYAVQFLLIFLFQSFIIAYSIYIYFFVGALPLSLARENVLLV